MAVFWVINGLYLFVFPDSNLLDKGYASIDAFFEWVPWVLLIVVPAITMRVYADEFKSGTFEILKTRPLSTIQLVGGKLLGVLLVVALTLLPTIGYAAIINWLSSAPGIDWGATAGSYLGLFLLAAVFAGIGCCCSSFTPNAVVAFLSSTVMGFLLYKGFAALSQLPFFMAGADYYIQMAGMDFHYRSLSRGVIDTRDLIYFFTLLFLGTLISYRNLLKR